MKLVLTGPMILNSYHCYFEVLRVRCKNLREVTLNFLDRAVLGNDVPN